MTGMEGRAVNLQGTVWIRKSDGMEAAVTQDKEAAAQSLGRPLRVKNMKTGKHFWTSPGRLRRKYHPSWDENRATHAEIVL